MKDVWRFIVMDSGGQYAVLGLALLMLVLFASNWDMTVPSVIANCHCMVHSGYFLIMYIFRASNQTVWRRTVPSLSTDTCFSMSDTCPVSLVSNCTQAAMLVCGKSFFVRKRSNKICLHQEYIIFCCYVFP